MLKDVHDAIQKGIDARMERLAFDLAGGGAPDYAKYREGVGRIKGLKDAKDIVSEAFKKDIEEES